MAHFAQLDENSIVTTVIVVSNDDCLDSDGSQSKKGIPFCQNLLGADTNWARVKGDGASIGMTYDSTNDVFYAQSPYASWTLNTSTWNWEAPVAFPDDAGFDNDEEPTEYVRYDWDEGSTSWTRTVINLAEEVGD